MILLASTRAAAILSQLQQGGQARTSLDLGRTETTVALEAGAVRLSAEELVSLEDLRRIVKCEDAIFSVRGGAVEKLIRYSEATRRSYKLRPTADWPALEISGILMHRIKGTTPREDARAKLRLVAPVIGAVLDTCLGLGYTAILAAETAGSVTAIEKDENVIEMARVNPYSQPLFDSLDADSIARGFPGGGGTIQSRRPQADGVESDPSFSPMSKESVGHEDEEHPGGEPLARFSSGGAPAAREPLPGASGARGGRSRIKLIQGDATEVVAGLTDGNFDLVNHDPPTLSIAGELYSDVFYEGLLRVLKPGGKLLHYTGAPGSKARGVDLGASVARRLERLGFTRVRADDATGCILANRRG